MAYQKKNENIYLMKRKTYEKNVQKIIMELKRNGNFMGLDTKIVTCRVLGMMDWLGKWYDRKEPVNIGEISNICSKTIMQGKLH